MVEIRPPQQLIAPLFLTERVSEIYFAKQANCTFSEAGTGGVFLQQHSVEACAQLCLNDLCCQSFEAGQPGSPVEGDCYLTRASASSIGGGVFTCHQHRQMDYYERIGQSKRQVLTIAAA